jgi:hypothetical protein
MDEEEKKMIGFVSHPGDKEYKGRKGVVRVVFFVPFV